MWRGKNRKHTAGKHTLAKKEIAKRPSMLSWGKMPAIIGVAAVLALLFEILLLLCVPAGDLFDPSGWVLQCIAVFFFLSLPVSSCLTELDWIDKLNYVIDEVREARMRGRVLEAVRPAVYVVAAGLAGWLISLLLSGFQVIAYWDCGLGVIVSCAAIAPVLVHFSKGFARNGGRVWHDSLFVLGTLAIVALVLVLLQVFFYTHTVESHAPVSLMALAAVAVLLMWSVYRLCGAGGYRVVVKLFFPVLVFMAMAYALFFPPGTVPDEVYHFRHSYAYSNLMLFTESPDEARVEDLVLLHADDGLDSTQITSEHWERVRVHLESPAVDVSVAFSDQIPEIDMSSNPLVLRLAPALGISFGRLLGLGCVPLYYLGRLFNMLFGVVLIAAAVQLAPVGRNVMMSVALLPMTLHLLGSYSYDVGITGLCFLYTALVLRAILGHGRISVRLSASIIVVAALLAPCKGIYWVLLFLVFLVPNGRFKTRMTAMIFKGLSFGIPMLVFGVMRGASVVSIAKVGSVPADFVGPQERLYTLDDILDDPLGSLVLLLNTLVKKGDFYLTTMVGGSLGYFQEDIKAPYFVSFFLCVLLLIASVRSSDDEMVLSTKQRAAGSAAFLVVLLGAIGSMWVGWTPFGYPTVEGVQGRYLLPALPLLLLALRGRGMELKYNAGPLVIFALVAVDISYLAYIAAQVAMAAT